ncbi:MAG: radical SAM protein [Candidatus Altiarchaeales archaeon]|nr:radical SAM protein [Candidatus Altiarchaeales archaeon]MBD3416897.1 radical SAM protein [Candidatus Altiarchaeales archaeon]
MLGKKFIPNLKKVEIEITSRCNLRCHNCDRSCGQAPSSESMSVEQIKKFVNESINLKWDWEYIGVIGGEPTLHPELVEILKILKKFKLFKRKNNNDCRIEVVTNGFGTATNEVLSNLPLWVDIRNSNKESSNQRFKTYNIAPIDLENLKDVDFTTGCRICSRDGLGLTRYGYYPCGAGASVDRVFGKDIGIKKLEDVNIPNLTKQLKILCSICGHFKYDKMDCEKVEKEAISKTWKKAYEEYKLKKPPLKIY